jgi:hypothetical protein
MSVDACMRKAAEFVDEEIALEEKRLADMLRRRGATDAEVRREVALNQTQLREWKAGCLHRARAWLDRGAASGGKGRSVVAQG